MTIPTLRDKEFELFVPYVTKIHLLASTNAVHTF